MSSIGEKIKEVLTGHHQDDSTGTKNPDTSNTPGAYPEDKPTHKDTALLNKLNKATDTGHGHHQAAGTSHHDPEVEAKQATSAAGNYPYWGDLPREGEHDTAGASHGTHTYGTGAAAGATGAAGALATGTGVTGSQGATGTTGDRSGLDLGSSQTSQTYSPQTTTTGTTDSRKKEYEALGAGAGLAGLGGAGYLASRNKNDDKSSTLDASHSPAQAGPGSLDPGYAKTQPSQSTGLYDTSSAGATGTQSGLRDDSHKKEAALATGAGLAGVGGAGYLASRSKNDQSQSYPEDRTTTTGLGSSSTPTTSGGIHNTVVGAGSGEAPSSYRSPLDSSNATTVGPQTTSGSTLGQQQSYAAGDLGAPKSGNDRDKQALAAAAGVGAGAGVVAAEEKHRHHHHHQDKHDERAPHDSSTTGYASGKPTDGDFYSSQRQAGLAGGSVDPTGSQSAQAAARQAWNKQDGQLPTSTSVGAGAGTGAADVGRSSKFDNTAAVGTATAVAGAGATAAYYGQGKEHDQNPRSGESEKIAARAMGADGTPQAPSSQNRGYGTSSSTGFGSSGSQSAVPGSLASGLAGSGQNAGSKVVHKCHQCGADNDISDYFKKDAAFRTGS